MARSMLTKRLWGCFNKLAFVLAVHWSFSVEARVPIWTGVEVDHSTAGSCLPLDGVRNTRADAAPIISQCLRAASELAIKPGRYFLLTPLKISKPARIFTDLPQKNISCVFRKLACASIVVRPTAAIIRSGGGPIIVSSDDVEIRSIIFKGFGGENRNLDQQICQKPETRESGGVIKVFASRFRISESVIRGASCSTALGVGAKNDGSVIEDNLIGPNGEHRQGDAWSDGVTIYDARNLTIRHNRFVDNTDVQLILGGCIHCEISHNRFLHSRRKTGGSFAELMIQAWHDSSGDFEGTKVFLNEIDCSLLRRCGFGLMLGGAPWYPYSVRGGVISGNSVSHAQMALNIDSIDGKVEIRDNHLNSSGGRFASSCGERVWAAINVSPKSRSMIAYAPVGASNVDTTGCILNQDW